VPNFWIKLLSDTGALQENRVILLSCDDSGDDRRTEKDYGIATAEV
jgi:hypothetical protein